MVELLQTSDTSTERDREVAESLSALLNGGGSKKKTPSVRVHPKNCRFLSKRPAPVVIASHNCCTT